MSLQKDKQTQIHLQPHFVASGHNKVTEKKAKTIKNNTICYVVIMPSSAKLKNQS